jgi:hypothetical protein
MDPLENHFLIANDETLVSFIKQKHPAKWGNEEQREREDPSPEPEVQKPKVGGWLQRGKGTNYVPQTHY